MSGVHHAALSAVERLCASATDVGSLRVAALTAMHRAIGFDAFVWVLTDPVTTVGSAPYAQVPALDSLPELISCKYLTAEHRWTSLPSGTGLLSDLSPGESRNWRAFLERYSVTDIASVVHADRHGTWAFLDLWRIGGQFTADDAALLSDSRAALTTALRTCQAATMAAVPEPANLAPGPVILLLDQDLQVVGDTETADRWLARLLPPAPGVLPVPAVVYNTAAQLLAQEAGVDEHPAWARVHLGGGHWATARATRLHDRSGSGRIAVTLEQTLPMDRLEIYVRAFGLSPRERSLVTLLADGLDTRAAAQLMHLSPHTLQDHLKSVFDKTGTRSRRVLLTRALGVAAATGPGATS